MKTRKMISENEKPTEYHLNSLQVLMSVMFITYIIVYRSCAWSVAYHL